MKSLYCRFLPVFVVVCAVSCRNDPESVQEEVFDPKNVTQQEFNAVKNEVQNFIKELNSIIRARNYGAWVAHLDANYFKMLDSREYLDRINSAERMKKASIRLSDAQDYFEYVVVPSRANDRVDDIEFISRNRVKAFTISQKGERLRLYDLEKAAIGWKIIN